MAMMNRRTGGIKLYPMRPARASAAAIDRNQYLLFGFFIFLFEETLLVLLLLLLLEEEDCCDGDVLMGIDGLPEAASIGRTDAETKSLVDTLLLVRPEFRLAALRGAIAAFNPSKVGVSAHLDIDADLPTTLVFVLLPVEPEVTVCLDDMVPWRFDVLDMLLLAPGDAHLARRSRWHDKRRHGAVDGPEVVNAAERADATSAAMAGALDRVPYSMEAVGVRRWTKVGKRQ